MSVWREEIWKFNGQLNMATAKDFLLKITKLNGENYRDWAFNMRLYLESMDLFGYADGSIGNPAEDASEQVKQAFRSALKKAWTYICLAVELNNKFM